MTGTDDERVGPMPNPPHLGELIRESMEETGWTVGETAARLSCERGTLSRVLNGRAGVSATMALERTVSASRRSSRLSSGARTRRGFTSCSSPPRGIAG